MVGGGGRQAASGHSGGDQIRLGIVAPPNVALDRAETRLEKQQGSEAASPTPVSAPASTVGETLNQIRQSKSLSS